MFFMLMARLVKDLWEQVKSVVWDNLGIFEERLCFTGLVLAWLVFPARGQSVFSCASAGELRVGLLRAWQQVLFFD